MTLKFDFKSIKSDAEKIFISVNKGDLSQLNLYQENLLKIKENDSGTYNIYTSEFSFYWNKLEINHFFKTNKIIDSPEFVSSQPSLWIYYWKRFTEKKITGIKTYQFRTIDVELIKKECEQLSLVFNKIFKNGEDSFVTFNNNKSEFNQISSIKSKKNFDETFVYFIYSLTGLSHFLRLEKEPEKELCSIFKIFFDEKLDHDNNFFSSYTPYNIRNDQNKLSQYIKNRVNYFLLSKNDLNFVSYINSKFDKNLVLDSISDMVKLENSNIDQSILKQFVYFELANEINITEKIQSIKHKI